MTVELVTLQIYKEGLHKVTTKLGTNGNDCEPGSRKIRTLCLRCAYDGLHGGGAQAMRFVGKTSRLTKFSSVMLEKI